MVHNSLTQGYLDEMGRRDVSSTALLDVAYGQHDLAATTYAGRCLSRPVFLDRSQVATLTADLANLHAALTALPDNVFGGDLAAFGRSVGMTEAQVVAILRTRGPAPTKLSRADLYHDGSAFRLLEFNMGSNLGGLDNAILNRAFLAHPVVAEFVASHKLSYVDTMAALVDTIRVECAFPPDARPFMAAVDWPDSYAQLEARLRYSAEQLSAFGIETQACHVGQLEVRDGRVWLRGRPVDVIYRLFMNQDLLDPAGPGLLDPLLRAVERGEVAMFAPMDAELFGSKGALALVSDEIHRHHYSAEQLTSLDRLLPWTRMVRTGPVTVDGTAVDLLEYAIDQREELVLKPTLAYGGAGVIPGWEVDASHWQAQLHASLDGPYVLQHRIRPVVEQFPSPEGLRPWVLNWGAFQVAGGYGGMLVRGAEQGTGDVVNLATGATAACCFHELDELSAG